MKLLKKKLLKNGSYMKRMLIFLWFVVSTQLVLAQCTTDCVWPGDLNANGVANNLDFLAIGFANGVTGPIRPNPSVNWEALSADDWAGTLAGVGSNFKHIDADGNGIIDAQDRLPISINYFQKNDDFVSLLGNNLPGSDLFAQRVDSIAAPGGSLIFDVQLGDANNPINDIYGIGFQIVVDTQYVENVTVDFSDSWLGQGDELISYNKFSDEIDHSGVAITRIDGNSVSGFGTIARVEIVITDVILGLQMDTTACLPFPIRFKQVLGIDEEGNDLLITTQSDTMSLKHPSQLTSTSEIATAAPALFDVYPNPATQQLTLSAQQPIRSIKLYNTLGVCVWQDRFLKNTPLYQQQINTAHWPRGFYFLSVETATQQSTKKILLK